MQCFARHFITFLYGAVLPAVLLACASPTASGNDTGLRANVLANASADNLLFDYLVREAASQFDARRKTLHRAGKSSKRIRAYQDAIRRRLASILGPWPDKTPLKPHVTGTLEFDGYRIEKIYFESRPHHHMTANAYVPAEGVRPFPAILVLPGHFYQASKAYEDNQRLCQLLARNGFLTLVVDPICQGERYQFLKPDGEPWQIRSTTTHSILDVGAMLVGHDVVFYQAWDNIRAIDYLLSRSDVDPKRIGTTGNSGGGTQTTFLMAIDDRIAAAAPSCYITSRERKFVNTGPQDGCQNLPNEGKFGIEIADYIIVRAPKPTLILAATRDFFDIDATRKVFAEAYGVYGALDQPRNVELFEVDDEHGYSTPRRHAFLNWIRRQMKHDSQPAIYPDAAVLPDYELRVTRTGQVLAEWDHEVSVAELTLDTARSLASSRSEFWKNNDKSTCLKKIRQLIGVAQTRLKPSVQQVGTIERKDCTIERLILHHKDDVPVPGLLLRPNKAQERFPATIYVDGSGKRNGLHRGGAIETLVNNGRIVLAIDVRGFGETADDPSKNETKYQSDEYRNSILAMHIGRPLIGQRVEDVLKAFHVLRTRKDVDRKRISLVGVGRAGPVILHAAALEQRFEQVTVRGSISSWMDIVSAPLKRNNHSHIVPSALVWYDLPDLLKLISPRSIRIVDPLRPPNTRS